MTDKSATERVMRIDLHGEFDLARREELTAALAPAAVANLVELHFIDTTYVDSTALGCLIHLRKKMREHDPHSRIRIIAPSGQMRKLLDIAGLLDIFEVRDEPAAY